MSTYISNKLRQEVAERASFCCEYCRVHQEDLHFAFQIDHIISEKHEGQTVLENLAYSCSFCNAHKGANLGTYLSGSKRLIRLFNPRKDRWNKHFSVKEGEVIGLSKIGKATIKVLNINESDKLMLRKVLHLLGRWPHV